MSWVIVELIPILNLVKLQQLLMKYVIRARTAPPYGGRIITPAERFPMRADNIRKVRGVARNVSIAFAVAAWVADVSGALCEGEPITDAAAKATGRTVFIHVQRLGGIRI